MGLKNPVNIMEPEDVGGPIPEWFVRPDSEESITSVQKQQNGRITVMEPGHPFQQKGGETPVEMKTPFG